MDNYHRSYLKGLLLPNRADVAGGAEGSTNTPSLVPRNLDAAVAAM